MSEFLKPQSPLQHKDGAYIYPLTTADQVILEDNSRLNVALEHLVYVDEEHQESAVAPLNADTLGGHPVEDFLRPKAGFIYPLAGSVIPEGFLLCDGAEYGRTEFPELFAAIGTIYGEGDGSTTFNVPNLQTRVPVGAGEGYGLGAVGGEATHTLTVDEMPSHRHSYTVNIQHVDGEQVSGESLTSGLQAGGRRRYSDNTDYKGGSQPHNNMQPYTVVNYIIATGKDTGVSVSDIVMGAQALPLEVQYGGTGATNAEEARQNLGITPENIGAMSMELLWRNASPNSEFGVQGIAADTQKYDAVIAKFRYASSDFFDPCPQTSVLCCMGHFALGMSAYPVTDSAGITYRIFDVYDGGVWFREGYEVNTEECHNQYCIPTELYGVKFFGGVSE